MNEKEQPEPAFDTPEYRMIGLERIVSTIPEGDEGAAAWLSASVAFIGDGDMVQEAEVLQKAADYFKAHPELSIQSANWTKFPLEDGSERFQLELTVNPPGWIAPDQARYIYPQAKR
ncbi:hypothetical protein [Streptomyces sp. NPDC005538]|uniref:hypothetical protein n=1 Tax=Streptomyces sp. NPDC005538 TaxID=3157043 RepID=UPI0033A71D5D